jgi:hypothetical protein
MAKAHPENVAGPFYVEDGCCITCGVPVNAAPDIFDWASNESSCVVKRQPVTQADLDRTMIAITSAEVDCVRYGGHDPAILLRLGQAGHAGNCDRPLAGVQYLVRPCVRFASSRSGDCPRDLAARLRVWLADLPWSYMRVKPSRSWSPNTAVFSWDYGMLAAWRAHYNSVRFEADPDGFRALLRHGHPGAGPGLGRLIHEWLTDAEHARGIRWYEIGEDWAGPGFHMPV